MKKISALLLAMVMVFAFTACGGSDAQTDESKDVVSYEKTGEVVNYVEGSITIDTADANELTFNIENAAINSEDDVAIGDIATVAYTGEIADNGDTSGCAVTSVTVKQGDESEIDGTLEKIDMNGASLTIKTDDGDMLTFDVSNAERHYTNGIKVGNKLEIMYMGKIDGTDTSKCTVLSVSDTNANKPAETVTVKSVNETVWATVSGLHVRSGSSTATTLIGTLNKGAKLVRTGILSNGWSRVDYQGKDGYISSQYLTTKAPKAPKTPDAKNPVLTGTVDEATTMDNLVLDSGGQQYSFATENAPINVSGGIIIGKTVNVEYTGTIDGVDTSGIKIVQIY